MSWCWKLHHFTSSSPWHHLYLHWSPTSTTITLPYYAVRRVRHRVLALSYNKKVSRCLAFLISPARYIQTCLMGFLFLLLSKQPHGNFNVTGGKTTHDMNGAWWDKHFIVEVWATLSLPTLLKEGSSDHRSHCSPMTRITQQTICTELFFSPHSHLSQGWLCTVKANIQT